MTNRRTFILVIFASLMLAGLWSVALGQNPENNLARVTASGSTVRWEVTAPNNGFTLTITAPDGRSFTKEYKSGASAEFTFDGRQELPDGGYGYELKLRPILTDAQKEEMKRLRGKDDDPEDLRAGRKRPALPNLIQSGAFAFLNGQVIVAGGIEDNRSAKVNVKPSGAVAVTSANTVNRLRNHRASLGVLPDQVIPDDLIVQQSLCVGFDCVNGEVFDFDTIRLKENNLRIHFDDTSTIAGYPANDWRIIANDSASGGSSKFSIEDTTGAKTPFTITAGASTNSIFVDSTGRVGMRTSTPVLDLHISTSNTPAMRYQQTNAGGFTAQTWDVGANEANFFVRDVTGGSKLSFRIRPGAPTSSIDISSDGDVGIGTASPGFKLDVNTSTNADGIRVGAGLTTAESSANIVIRPSSASSAQRNWMLSTFFDAVGGLSIRNSNAALGDPYAAGTTRFFIDTNGQVGIGTVAPDQKLSVSGDASKSAGGGSWQVFSDKRLKNIKGGYTSGLSAVMQLKPIRFQYKPDNALGLQGDFEQIGFGAQDLQKVIPEAVSKNANGYLTVNNDPIIWTMLNAIKEQQKQIEQLKGQIRKLQATSHRRRK